MKRRDFLKSSAAMTAAATISPSVFFQDKNTPIGLQLWSVRDAMEKDPKAVLASLSKQGYKFVESFGFKDGGWFGMPAAELKQVLSGLGMRMVSSHQMITTKEYNEAGKQLPDSFKQAVDAAVIMGQKYIICPYMADEDRNETNVKQLCEIFNKAGEYTKSKGIRYGYHNHDFEFTIRFANNEPMYRTLLDNTDPKLVAMEMDMCWVTRGKYSPVDWFKLYPGRFELCHMKDLVAQDKSETAIVGTGIVDFKQIIANQKLAGMKYWIVELENYTNKGSVPDVAVSYQNLRKIL